jgi:biopolymer transport protein ExbD
MRGPPPAVAVLLLAAACRGSPPEPTVEVPGDVPVWRATASDVVGDRWPTLAVRERREVFLPEAPTWELDAENGESGRLVLNVLPNGLVQFKGVTYDLSDPATSAHASSELFYFVRQLTAFRPRGEDGVRAVTVMIHADRAARWQWIAALLRGLADPDVDVRRLQIAVRSDRGGKEARISATSEPIVQRASAEPTLAVALAAAPEPEGGDAPAVHVRVADARFDFPAARFEDEAFLAAANERWSAVRSALADHDGDAQSVVLAADERVPWAHVVTAVGLLREAGLSRVALPEASVVLGPWASASGKAPSRMRHDGPGVGLLLVCLAVALGLALLSASPLLRSARRRPRDRSGPGGA